jgi:hypothetical protein
MVVFLYELFQELTPRTPSFLGHVDLLTCPHIILTPYSHFLAKSDRMCL